ncbi:MAG: ExbD/TolR family protein [Verrucomicrobiales bacterium]
MIRRAEVVGKQLEELLKLAAPAPNPPESALEITPPSNAGNDLEPKTMVVNLSADGTLTLAGQPCPLDQLADRLKALAAKGPVSIRLQADRKTPYQQVVNVIDACRVAGVMDVNFKAEKP